MIDTSVAVVIATHNRLEQLKEAIASVRLQGRAINEIVVVDDASDDGTSRWLSTCDGVRAFRMDGVEDAPSSVRAARARNRGLAEVRSRLVLFLDDDDRLRPRSVERLLAALEHHRRAMFAVGGRIIFSDDGASRRARNYPRFTVKRDILPDLLARTAGGRGMGDRGPAQHNRPRCARSLDRARGAYAPRPVGVGTSRAHGGLRPRSTKRAA